MTITTWQLSRVFWRTEKDDTLYKKWCGDLPWRGELTPFHSEAHSIRQFRAAFRILGVSSPHVLETGFCLGHSARIMLGLCAESVTSIESSTRMETLQALAIMGRTNPSDFDFILADTNKDLDSLLLKLHGRRFDLMFVDGNHERVGVECDVQIGLRLGIQYFLFDDIYPKWGPGVLDTIEARGLIPLANLGTMMLCCTPDVAYDE